MPHLDGPEFPECPSCPGCGRMAGCCENYPRCPGNPDWQPVEHSINCNSIYHDMQTGLPYPCNCGAESVK